MRVNFCGSGLTRFRCYTLLTCFRCDEDEDEDDENEDEDEDDEDEDYDMVIHWKTCVSSEVDPLGKRETSKH